ncbi:MAG: hypothetical protein WBL22_15965, partial [Candidatus Sulfotelmatobacter sp.]
YRLAVEKAQLGPVLSDPGFNLAERRPDPPGSKTGSLVALIAAATPFSKHLLSSTRLAAL